LDWISSFGKSFKTLVLTCRLLLSVTLVFAILGARNADLPNSGRPLEYTNNDQGDKTHDVVGEEHEMEDRRYG
jgi:hypothetical protein